MASRPFDSPTRSGASGRVIGLGTDPAARPPRPSDAEEFLQQVRDASETVEIDALPRGSDRGPPAGKPVAQGRGAQGLRMEHVHEPQRLQALGADELLPSRLYPGHDERGLFERQDLVDGVVPAHRDDALRATHQARRLVYE